MGEGSIRTDSGKEKRSVRSAATVHLPVCSVHLFRGQGSCYPLMGLWPLFSITSFMTVTGPKTDIWLAKTVGLLLAVSGAVLITVGFRRNPPREIPFPAVGTAGALAAVDIFYAAAGGISWVYLLDALLELAFIALWTAVLIRRYPS